GVLVVAAARLASRIGDQEGPSGRVVEADSHLPLEPLPPLDGRGELRERSRVRRKSRCAVELDEEMAVRGVDEGNVEALACRVALRLLHAVRRGLRLGLRFDE